MVFHFYTEKLSACPPSQKTANRWRSCDTPPSLFMFCVCCCCVKALIPARQPPRIARPLLSAREAVRSSWPDSVCAPPVPRRLTSHIDLRQHLPHDAMWRRETKSWQHPYTPETRARCYNLEPSDMCIYYGGAGQTSDILPRVMRACFSFLVPWWSMAVCPIGATHTTAMKSIANCSSLSYSRHWCLRCGLTKTILSIRSSIVYPKVSSNLAGRGSCPARFCTGPCRCRSLGLV